MRAPVSLVICSLALPALAQRPLHKDLPRNDPRQCMWCEGDEERMQAFGIVSHGGFGFANSDTKGVDELLATSEILWVESEHFEIGFALRNYKIGGNERDKIRAELTSWVEIDERINPKARTIDPWLRAHLYARRCEALYDEMLDLLQVKDEEFPDGTKLWDMTTPYMGEGPYMGQKGKFELLILPSVGASETFLREQFGLRIRRTQRYNVVPTDSLVVVIPTDQGGLRADEALHGHVAFNLAQSFLDGYKHYSYDLPVWIREGIAHWFERKISPRFNSFDGSEGSATETSRKSDWELPVRKAVLQEKAPRMAQLLALRGFGEFTRTDHYVTWSMVDFLTREHPDFLARLLAGIKGLHDKDGYSDGSQLEEIHRKLFKDDLGLGYAGFDRAWREWVLAHYGA